jgi:hypothetical protein
MIVRPLEGGAPAFAEVSARQAVTAVGPMRSMKLASDAITIIQKKNGQERVKVINHLGDEVIADTSPYIKSACRRTECSVRKSSIWTAIPGTILTGQQPVSIRVIRTIRGEWAVASHGLRISSVSSDSGNCLRSLRCLL